MLIEIEYGGEKLKYDAEQIPLKVAFVVKAHTGMGLRTWARAVDDIDPIAMQALLWAVFQQNDRRCEIASVDLNPIAFSEAFNKAVIRTLEDMAAAAEAKQPDPTRRSSARRSNGTTRKRIPTSKS